jgi:hypothetical protein
MRPYRFCNVEPVARDPVVGHRPAMSNEPHDDLEVVVVDRQGSSLGTILGVIVIALLLVGVWYFAFGPGQGSLGGDTTQPNDINVDVELPSVPPEGS